MHYEITFPLCTMKMRHMADERKRKHQDLCHDIFLSVFSKKKKRIKYKKISRVEKREKRKMLKCPIHRKKEA